MQYWYVYCSGPSFVKNNEIRGRPGQKSLIVKPNGNCGFENQLASTDYMNQSYFGSKL